MNKKKQQGSNANICDCMKYINGHQCEPINSIFLKKRRQAGKRLKSIK